jgi:DNA-directed RNA polymerase specialized sigma24 family protein
MGDTMRVSDISDAEWRRYLDFAKMVSSREGRTVLGHEDYAAEAIARLWERDEAPENIESWLRAVIRNAYISRARKLNSKSRKSASIRGLDSEEMAAAARWANVPSADADLIRAMDANELLNALTYEEHQILTFSVAGWTTAEIAKESGFADGKSLATKLGKIKKKVRETAENVF